MIFFDEWHKNEYINEPLVSFSLSNMKRKDWNIKDLGPHDSFERFKELVYMDYEIF